MTNKTTHAKAQWLAIEYSASGCSIWGMHGFMTEAEAAAYAEARPGFKVQPAGEVVLWIPVKETPAEPALILTVRVYRASGVLWFTTDFSDYAAARAMQQEYNAHKRFRAVLTPYGTKPGDASKVAVSERTGYPGTTYYVVSGQAGDVEAWYEQMERNYPTNGYSTNADRLIKNQNGTVTLEAHRYNSCE